MVIDDYFNTTNGMSISTQRFAKQLRQLGHEVRILSTSSNDNKVDYPVPRIKPVLFSNLISQQGYIFDKPVDSTIQKAVQWADIVHLDTPFFLVHEREVLPKNTEKRLQEPFIFIQKI